ncbi:lysine (K)-specific demethylase 2Aa isoform X2 [Xiphias gladius]|uniref:lysine (K)-specific demethylase 2Aa isoform X2 n=1 Tax=Xiphias gladius TaxID=8245 RepID=UPI001A98DB3D|nr:lysine (K)-specific demethylase 2Aa isoform X2 [Xiphias gladius]
MGVQRNVQSSRAGTRRRYHDDGISDEEIDGRRMFDLEEKVNSQRFSSDRVIRMEGRDLTYEFIQRGGLRDPIIFEKSDGLGIKMPDPDFSVNNVKMFVGSRRMIDVMDVSTQKGTEMSMAQWTRYYETPPSQREKLYNVISLEFSHTKLENLVKRPTTVDLIDWVDNMWPRHLKERQRDSTNSINDMQYPKVQKYCLMSVEGCYTDFHIDFGGTSVWYHILRGSKVFWLIPPTPQNLELYENWVLSGKQGDVFLGDRASDCQRIELKQGCTFIIPSGWIHAVYTPVDSMVFGGNFLHSFNIPMQLNICNIEDRTRVPVKFRYPFYYEMCWYVLERYVFSLTKTSYLTPEFQKHSLGIGLKKPSGSDPASEQEKEGVSGGSEEEASERQCDKSAAKTHLTPLELEGLRNLLGKLEALPSNKKCVPAGIHNAPALITHIKVILKEHTNDNPKFSYTGKPIVKWPKRPSWYQPPPPPPPPPRPKLASTPIIPRPQKPASSMSVLRRRRVRCKRCEACMRPECGDCNFCRDMKKFGGPGKLKQTCVLRQCLSPGLPLSAVCEICKEPNQEESGDPSLTLMECSNCAQIVHPACLTVQGEGLVNKDLPSCWECPKCVQGITDPESSGSDESLAASHQQHIRPHGPLVLRLGPGPSATIGGPVGSQQDGEVIRCGFFPPPLPSCSSSSSASLLLVAAPLPSQPISSRLQSKGDKGEGHAVKRKSSSLLDARMAKIYRRQRHSHDGDDSASDDDDEASQRRKMALHARGGSHTSRRGFGANRRGLLRGGLAQRGSRGGLMTPGSSSILKLKRGMGMRESGRRGRGVRLRGGSRMQRRGDESEESDDDDDEEEDEEEEEDSEDGDKERRHRQRRRRRRTDDDEDEDEDSEGQEFDPEEEEMDTLEDEEEEEEEEEVEEEGRWDSDPEPPVLLVSDLNDDLLSGSYLTVTLQRPHKAKRQSGSIVPKLEAAMGPRTAAVGAVGQHGFIQRKTTLSKPSRLKTTDTAADSVTSRGPGSVSRNIPEQCNVGMNQSPHIRPPAFLQITQGLLADQLEPEYCAAWKSQYLGNVFFHHFRPRLRGNNGDRGTRDRSASSSEEQEAATPPTSSSLSPPSLLSLPSFKDVGNERGGEKEVWVSVFRYLSRAELLACMTVCKAWYKWSCDKRLWSHVDVSRCSPLSNQALAGIIKRQPTSLDLSWTPLAKRQLNCLLTRLPGLRELRVTGLSWSCLSSLVSPALPYLRLLDMRWCEGLKDSQIKEIITPPGSESSRSRLRNMVTLRLSGLDISESTLRLLQRHMPQLERLDLAHCKDITDSSIALLAAAGTHTRNNLTELTLAGCSELTDGCLLYLKRLSSLTLLDLRGCKSISRQACDAFISDLSHFALYCMMEEKLIQRLD